MSSRPLPSTTHRPVRADGVLGGVALAHEVAHAADLRARRLPVPPSHGHRHAAGDVVVAAAVEVGQDARPHQQHDAAVAVVLAHHGAAHLDQRRPQRVECADVELRGGVEPARGDGAGRREHAVAADELAGVVLADQQVVAELVEAVGVSAVDVAVVEFESGLGGEHLVAQALRGFDERRVGGQQQGVARPSRAGAAPSTSSAAMSTDAVLMASTVAEPLSETTTTA